MCRRLRSARLTYRCAGMRSSKARAIGVASAVAWSFGMRAVVGASRRITSGRFRFADDHRGIADRHSGRRRCWRGTSPGRAGGVGRPVTRAIAPQVDANAAAAPGRGRAVEGIRTKACGGHRPACQRHVDKTAAVAGRHRCAAPSESAANPTSRWGTRACGCRIDRQAGSGRARRQWCPACGTVKRERLDFPADNPRFSKRFAGYVGGRCG